MYRIGKRFTHNALKQCYPTTPFATLTQLEVPPPLCSQQWCEVVQNNLQVLAMPLLATAKINSALMGARMLSNTKELCTWSCCLPNTSNFSNSTGQKMCKCMSPVFLTYPWCMTAAMKMLQAPCSLTVCCQPPLSWTNLGPLRFPWLFSVASRERAIFFSIQRFLLTPTAAARARLWGNIMHVI